MGYIYKAVEGKTIHVVYMNFVTTIVWEAENSIEDIRRLELKWIGGNQDVVRRK
jgi:hypothetical protein